MVLIVGVDEAGRGPVIGPLVVAGVSIEEKDLDKLKSLGVKDSKLLSPKQRERLYSEIIKIVKNYKIIIIQPEEIDEAIESEMSNLNQLETEKFAVVINYLKPNRVVIDCPSINREAYKEKIRVYIKGKMNIICEHKADVNHVEVGAASILAKVTRDKEIEEIKERIGIDFGSGYPSDEITKKFLEKYWDKYTHIFRHSWSSYKNIAAKKKQTKLEEF
jgi:ribonuclease HII